MAPTSTAPTFSTKAEIPTIKPVTTQPSNSRQNISPTASHAVVSTKKPITAQQSAIKKNRFALTVLPEPSTARIRILNIRPKYRPGIELKPGNYHLEISHPGHPTKKRWIAVHDNDVEVVIELTPQESFVFAKHTEPETDTAQHQATQTQTTTKSHTTAVQPRPVAPAVPPYSTTADRHDIIVAEQPDTATISRQTMARPYANISSKPRIAPNLPQREGDAPSHLPVMTQPAQTATVQQKPSYSPQRIAAVQHQTTTRQQLAKEQMPPSNNQHYALTVQTDPDDARIRVMNIVPRYQPGMLLPPGNYRLRISRPGYQTKTRNVALGQDDLSVNIALTKIAGKKTVSKIDKRSQTKAMCQAADRYTLSQPRQHVLTVQSNPEDARVQILNIKPPYKHGMSLPPGFYHFSVSREAYKTKQCWGEIVDEDLILDIPLEAMDPDNLFALTITTKPADARVRLLNTRIPYRPGVLLPPGPYQVEVAKRGYKKERVSVDLGQNNKEVAVTLTALTLDARPTLTVVPVIKKAQVRIINANVPYQPGMPLVPGKYLVEVAKPGFKTRRSWVELSEKNLRVEIEMEDAEEVNTQPITSLTIQPTPKDAKIRILNIKPSYHPGIKLKPGRYLIEVSKPGYQSKRYWITRPGSHKPIPVVLQKN